MILFLREADRQDNDSKEAFVRRQPNLKYPVACFSFILVLF